MSAEELLIEATTLLERFLNTSKMNSLVDLEDDVTKFLNKVYDEDSNLS